MVGHFLLDTNICIYIRRRRPREVAERFRRLRPGDAVLSVVTWGELCYGAAKSRERSRAESLLEALRALVPVEPMPAAAGETYGAIRADLELRGEAIGNNDLWIAAHALAAGLVLVTNDEGEFRRVPGLKIENWAA